MNLKRTLTGINNMCLSKKIVFLILISFLSSAVYADGEHHKNTLVGGRAATMGGSYTAVSDDASGSFYNPAGLVYASGDSISGSANTFSLSRTTYKQTIGNKDWERENTNLLPNFFGLVRKAKDFSLGLSYVVTDSFIEHQDQLYQNLTEVTNPIRLYALNIHSEDNTYQMGPTLAMKLTDRVSAGLTAYYHYRVYRRAQSQLIKFTDSSDESSYLNTLKKEKGAKLKFGLMATPTDQWSLGATIAKTEILAALTDNQQNTKVKTGSAIGFGQNAEITKRKMPYELSAGAAYFPSPYLLVSFDTDYFKNTDSAKEDVLNYSLGLEYFLNEKNALRVGIFTNNSNSKEPSAATTAPLEHIDYKGVSLGYGIYSKNTSITLGAIYSKGDGKAQPYSGSSVIKDFSRETINVVLAADYGI
jgi:long-subunit fatty acid transport protein